MLIADHGQRIESPGILGNPEKTGGTRSGFYAVYFTLGSPDVGSEREEVMHDARHCGQNLIWNILDQSMWGGKAMTSRVVLLTGLLICMLLALSIAQTDDGRADPFTLARLTIRGDAVQLRDGPKDSWLKKFPEQAINFTLADFSFWEITPRDARFVAGFGSIHNLSAEQLKNATR